MTEVQLQYYFSNDFTTMTDFENNVMSYIFTDHYEKDLTHISLVEKGDYKPKVNDCIKDILQCGRITSLDATDYGYLYEVILADKTNIARSRVNIMQAVKSILETYAHALVVFHYENTKDTEWRFTYMHKGSNQKDSTQVKRYTYLCGKGHPSHTITKNFITLKNSNFSDEAYLKAFNESELSKEFYEKLFAWYEWACENVTFPIGDTSKDKNGKFNVKQTKDNNELHLIRLITRLMFVWFIKQKDLIPSWVFDESELNKVLTEFKPESKKDGDYYNAILQNLFFAALNKKIEERAFADDKSVLKNKQFGVKNFYRDNKDKTFFKENYAQIIERFKTVPFLNGGLFECLDKLVDDKENKKNIEVFTDGFSREPDWMAFIPNNLFWQKDDGEHEGIIHLLSRYNFTVEESTPIDVQVALDPELLGKIFENLLGSYNPETRESARKESGSFYTPREIVSYMVNSSIKAYLQEKVPEVGEENLERLTNDNKADDSEIKLTEEQINKIRSALFEIKIIDPACGSGAFPMGILNKLVEIHVLLDKLSARTKSKHNLYIKKGQAVNYNPDESLKINAEYLGNQEFKLYVNGKEESTIYNSQDLALHVKEIINRHNKELGKNTIANLFSQGRIDDGKSFNSIKTKTDIHQIVDEDTKDIIWQYRSYNVKNKFRQYRNEEKQALSIDAAEEDNDFEYAKYLYSLKTRIIQDSIFGVDIQPIAVQISKLRFFISLICEQPKIENHPEENYGYNPLPNLETKFVAANTLIGKAKKPEYNKSMVLFANPRIDEITKELGEIRKAHFSAKTAYEKKENREQDEKLRKELSQLLEEDKIYSPEDAKQLAEWNPYDQSAPASSFFDAEWMFGVRDGFDVVIGNPPYIDSETMTKAMPEMRNTYSSIYETAKGNWDIYILFFEFALKHSRTGGTTAFIVPNKIVSIDYAEAVRDYISKNAYFISLRDYSRVPVFEASVYPCTLIFSKAKTDFVLIAKMNDLDEILYSNRISNKLFFSQNNWNIWLGTPNEVSLLTKLIEKSLFSIKDKYNVSAAATVNEAYIVKELLKNGVYNSKKFKLINSGTIDKYVSLWGIKDTKYIKSSYSTPVVDKTDVKKNLPNRYDLATSEKLIIASMTKVLEVYYDNGEYLAGKSTTCIYQKESDFGLKFILGCLNSKLESFWLIKKYNSQAMSGEAINISTSVVQNLPIPPATPAQQKPIIALVDKILTAKKANPQADTSKEEHRIDLLVYHLYGLSFDEAKIIDEGLREEEFNKESK